jgi:hypothetical protein
LDAKWQPDEQRVPGKKDPEASGDTGDGRMRALKIGDYACRFGSTIKILCIGKTHYFGKSGKAYDACAMPRELCPFQSLAHEHKCWEAGSNYACIDKKTCAQVHELLGALEVGE